MQKIVIKPSKGLLNLNFNELWEYRELLYFLTWRNIKVRYSQTIVGIAWVVIQPLLATAIFSVIFGKFLKLPSKDFPYVVVVFCAFLSWNMLANSISKAGNGLVMSRGLITKVYFPRLLIPVAITAENLVDFCLSTVIFFIILFLYKITLIANLIFLPFFVLLLLMLVLGMSFWLSALDVKYRDVHHIIPFIIQIWFYSSPVAYITGIIPEKWILLYALNPIVGIIDGFRWCFLGSAKFLEFTLPISIVVTMIIFITGTIYFYKTEKTFADII